MTGPTDGQPTNETTGRRSVTWDGRLDLVELRPDGSVVVEAEPGTVVRMSFGGHEVECEPLGDGRFICRPPEAP